MDGRRSGQTRVRMRSVERGRVTSHIDLLATEEPMEIRMRHGRSPKSIAVTMRTPGDDFELAAGFLFAEGLLKSRGELNRLEYCVECEGDNTQKYNIVTAVMNLPDNVDMLLPTRNFGMTSSCGLCGKERLDQIERQGIEPIATDATVDASVITELPDKLREAQGLFATTGGLHAAGLFTVDGELEVLREDVGRHNAVDKVIGWALLNAAEESAFREDTGFSTMPKGADASATLNRYMADKLLMVSGRSSFEIAQKALAAGIPIVCAVSAPSSLAVDLARRFEMTLVGFLREDRFNIYSGANRIL